MLWPSGASTNRGLPSADRRAEWPETIQTGQPEPSDARAATARRHSRQKQRRQDGYPRLGKTQLLPEREAGLLPKRKAGRRCEFSFSAGGHNDSDQRLATAGLSTPLDPIASPLHRLVRHLWARLTGAGHSQDARPRTASFAGAALVPVPASAGAAQNGTAVGFHANRLTSQVILSWVSLARRHSGMAYRDSRVTNTMEIASGRGIVAGALIV